MADIYLCCGAYLKRYPGAGVVAHGALCLIAKSQPDLTPALQLAAIKLQHTERMHLTKAGVLDMAFPSCSLRVVWRRANKATQRDPDNPARIMQFE